MISRRGLEVVTGALTGAFGLAVVVSSIEIGSGWSEGGVESGTFPLIAGVLICLGSLFNVGRSLATRGPTLVGLPEARRLVGLFIPALAFVIVIPVIGIYAASAAYLLWALSIQHRAALWRAVLIAAATDLTLYLLFERTFQILLPQGWLGVALGF
jgi:hypothetical protein